MISPFFVGLIADRYFASEKLLGVLGLLGGGIMFLLPQMRTFGTFYPLLILYCATYVPTLALGNSLSLHQLENAKTTFPRVKMLSAVGWIAGGLTVSAIGAENSHRQFYLAGALSIVFGLFAFTLPHTPPKKVGQGLGRRDPRAGRPGPVGEAVVRHLHRLHVPDLHPALLLLREHAHLPRRTQLVERGREDDARPGLGRGVPVRAAGDAPLPRLQDDHLRRHPGLGGALLLPGAERNVGVGAADGF